MMWRKQPRWAVSAAEGKAAAVGGAAGGEEAEAGGEAVAVGSGRSDVGEIMAPDSLS